MIFLSSIINSIPPGSRDLVEFGFFMFIGITAGSAGLLGWKLKKKFYANIAEEQQQTEYVV